MTALRYGLASAVLALLIMHVFGGGVTSKLQIHIPNTLSKPGGYDHREALFGVPPYGGSIQQQLYYAGSDLCDTTKVDTHGGYPERAVDSSGKMASWPSPYILMVDRGGCTFVNKVRNAQRSGAAGVIIADTTCLCPAFAAKTCQSDVECEVKEPVMADDGSGSDITIPSFLMFKQDADPVIAEVKANRMVRIEMAWSLPNPDARVEYEFWTTPTDMVSREFQREFKEAAVALGSHAYFTPHMFIYDGLKSGCQDAKGQNQCYNLCTNNGRYCATDPDNNLDEGISGADVVMESLRRQCVWKIYGEEDGIGAQWWDYVAEFLFRCDNDDFFASDECVKDAMSHAKVDNAKVEACIADTGGIDKDDKNTLLQSQLDAKETAGVVILPTAYVNNAAIRGALEFATIFKAICAGFSKGSAPSVCDKCASCGVDEYTCVVAGKCPDTNGSVSVPVFAISMGVVVFCFGCLGLIQWQRSQRQMRDQVRGILAEYMPLDENNKVESAGIPLDQDDDAEFT